MKTTIGIIIGILTIAGIIWASACAWQGTKSDVVAVKEDVREVKLNVNDIIDTQQMMIERNHEVDVRQVTAQMEMNQRVSEFMLEFKKED